MTKKSLFPLWVFVLVALEIALFAFAFAQVQPGGGMIVALGGSMLWVTLVARRGTRLRRPNG